MLRIAMDTAFVLFENRVIKLYLKQADSKTFLFFVVFLKNENDKGIFFTWLGIWNSH